MSVDSDSSFCSDCTSDSDNDSENSTHIQGASLTKQKRTTFNLFCSGGSPASSSSSNNSTPITPLSEDIEVSDVATIVVKKATKLNEKASVEGESDDVNDVNNIIYVGDGKSETMAKSGYGTESGMSSTSYTMGSFSDVNDCDRNLESGDVSNIEKSISFDYCSDSSKSSDHSNSLANNVATYFYSANDNEKNKNNLMCVQLITPAGPGAWTDIKYTSGNTLEHDDKETEKQDSNENLNDKHNSHVCLDESMFDFENNILNSIENLIVNLMKTTSNGDDDNELSQSIAANTVRNILVSVDNALRCVDDLGSDVFNDKGLDVMFLLLENVIIDWISSSIDASDKYGCEDILYCIVDFVLENMSCWQSENGGKILNRILFRITQLYGRTLDRIGRDMNERILTLINKYKKAINHCFGVGIVRPLKQLFICVNRIVFTANKDEIVKMEVQDNEEGKLKIKLSIDDISPFWKAKNPKILAKVKDDIVYTGIANTVPDSNSKLFSIEAEFEIDNKLMNMDVICFEMIFSDINVTHEARVMYQNYKDVNSMIHLKWQAMDHLVFEIIDPWKYNNNNKKLDYIEICVNDEIKRVKIDGNEFMIGSLCCNNVYNIGFKLNYTNGTFVQLTKSRFYTLSSPKFLNSQLRFGIKFNKYANRTLYTSGESNGKLSEPIVTEYGSRVWIQLKYPKPVFISKLRLNAAFVSEESHKFGWHLNTKNSKIECFNIKKNSWDTLKLLINDIGKSAEDAQRATKEIKIQKPRVVTNKIRLFCDSGRILLNNIIIE